MLHLVYMKARGLDMLDFLKVQHVVELRPGAWGTAEVAKETLWGTVLYP